MLEFPGKCPEAHPKDTTTRTVAVIVETRTKIWLALTDAPWAIEYMHEQHRLKGVAAVEPDDVGPGGDAPVPQTPWVTGQLPGEEVPVAALTPLAAAAPLTPCIAIDSIDAN